MPRVKARQSKDAFVQARVTASEKAILQKYADQLGITLSQLLQMTVRNLTVIARGGTPTAPQTPTAQTHKPPDPTGSWPELPQ